MDFGSMFKFYKENCFKKEECDIDLASFLKPKKDGLSDAEIKRCYSKYTQIYIQT